MKHCIFRQTYRCRRCYIGGGGWGRRLSDFVPQSQSLSVSVPVPLQFCTLTASSCNVQPHISAPLSLSLSLRPRFSSFSSVGALSNRVRGGRAASEAVVWGRPFDWNYKSGTGSRVCLFRFCLLLFPWFVLVLWFVVVRLPGLLAAEWVNQPARSPTPASTHLLLNTLSCATDIDRSNNIGRWRTLETVLITKCKQTCPYTFYLNHLKVKQFGFETPLYYAGLSRDRDHRTLCALSNSNGERRRETPVERGRKFRVFTLFAWQASNLEFLLKCLQ